MIDKNAKKALNGFSLSLIVNKITDGLSRKRILQEIYEKMVDDYDILMYSSYTEGKWKIAEKFVSILMRKIYKKGTAWDSLSYIDSLDMLVDEYNDTCHCPIGKTPICADYSALSEEFEKIINLLNWMLATEYKNIFSKGYIKK